MKNREIAGLEVIEVTGDPDGATIILFHGFGSSSMDLVPLSGVFQGSPAPTWLFPNGPLEIPIMPGHNGRAWFPVDMQALQTALQMGDYDSVANAFPGELDDARLQIERLIIELKVPRSKLILGGFSQGAVLAIESALHGMDRLAALLIFSGTLICEPNWRRLSHLHSGTPFFQSHGIDDPILPMKKAENLERLLLDGGLRGNLHKFDGGHSIPQSILSHFNSFLLKLL